MTDPNTCCAERPGATLGCALRRALRRVLRRALLGASAVALLVLGSKPASADSCTITSTMVSFGVYSVFATLPNNNGVGSLTISCKGGSANVTLSTGQSNSYVARTMTSGANTLNYNLYTSAARNVIWGDGTGVSRMLTAAKNSTTTLGVFGKIPAGQDAAVGTYTDSIIAIVTF